MAVRKVQNKPKVEKLNMKMKSWYGWVDTWKQGVNTTDDLTAGTRKSEGARVIRRQTKYVSKFRGSILRSPHL